MSKEAIQTAGFVGKDNLVQRLFLTSDSVGGWISVAIGCVSLAQGLALGLGTLRRLGSGGFPFGIGVLLIGLGALLIVGSLRRGGATASIPIKVSSVLILAALASFAVLLPLFGMIPAAIVLMLLVSVAVTGRLGLGDIIFSLASSVAAVLIFINGLGLALPAIRWPL
ncbi:hypothetical protein GCM10011385_35780 [Nitratireductor aestuarii]|uniref:DUF1468 domain-containing protein n=1 Tax=Nitratireductor aestuarii TaxID=1735103 RepID=A0A916RZX0_9HYPH|nr:tripartite tricarboxylate transporter TctB family protein [Nitratireductor aestuarii]GGA78478.1 hypothetical protein GCM10011385_35780 [Nitratireductor aestuarii]